VNPSALELENVWVRAGSFVLRDVSFSIDKGQVLVILGPSGAGKSVLLETIAGFYWPDQGRIRVAGRDVTRAAPEERRIGFMFQDYALFPHLTVGGNINFGLKARKGARQAGRAEMEDLLGRLDLKPLMERKPATLSGGEKQRVALARALVTSPDIFLFDEPLSALDTRAREDLCGELRTFLRESGIPAVYVTHNQGDALILADRVAVIRNGQLVQTGSAVEVFSAPADEFVARFVGVENILEGRVVSREEGIVTVELSKGLSVEAADHGRARSDRVLVCIRPEDVALSLALPAGSSVRNHFQGRVLAAQAMGPLVKVTLECGFPLLAYVTRLSFLDLGLEPGREVVASVKATAVHLIPREAA
jgi:molybdate/tungstate transport system ATP-binding protein